MHDGVHTSGLMFLSDVPNGNGGPEDVARLLNDDRTFIPFQSADPSIDTWIVNKRQIMRVHLKDCDAFRDDPALAAPVPTCTILLGDRSRLTGQLLHYTPDFQSRLVDKFNTAPEFLTFITDEGVDFVHRIHVTQVFQHG